VERDDRVETSTTALLLDIARESDEAKREASREEVVFLDPSAVAVPESSGSNGTRRR
jgi:hypothetical protein